MSTQYSRVVLPVAMLVWTGVVAYLWWSGFPDLPNDVKLADPNTLLVYEVGHCVFYAVPYRHTGKLGSWLNRLSRTRLLSRH